MLVLEILKLQYHPKIRRAFWFARFHYPRRYSGRNKLWSGSDPDWLFKT